MKKMTRRIVYMFIAAVLTLITFTGCSSSDVASGSTASGSAAVNSSGAEKSGEVVLKIGLSAEPPSFDPADFNLVATTQACYDCYDTLLNFDSSGNGLEPAIAESWNQVDNLTYVYNIRKGVKFSDGSDLTMDDILYSMNRVKDKKYGMSYLFEPVKSFEADKDKWTLTVHLSHPDSTWKYVPATSPCTIIKKSVVEAEGSKYGTHDGSVVGTGPYKFVSWVAGSQINLEKNKYWWGGSDNLKVDKVKAYIMTDPSAMALAAKGGQLDFVSGFSKDVTKIYKGISNSHINTCDGTISRFLAFNTQIAPFNDINARKAFAYCINKETITTAIGGEYAEVSGPMPMTKPMYSSANATWSSALSSMEDYSQDYAKAKEYLAKSAYPNGFAVDFYCTNVDVKMAELVKSMAAQAGITVNIKEILPADMFSYMYGFNADDKGHRPYQMFAGNWLSDYIDPVGYLKPIYHSDSNFKGGANQASYSNKDFDALITKTYSTNDEKERTNWMIEASKIATQDCPYDTLFTVKDVYWMSNKFNYKPSPQMFWNFSYAQFEVK